LEADFTLQPSALSSRRERERERGGRRETGEDEIKVAGKEIKREEGFGEKREIRKGLFSSRIEYSIRKRNRKK
jgi:hypothetical protein